MAELLRPARLKLQRAQEHLESLYHAIHAFLWRDPYRTAVYLDVENDERADLVVKLIVRETPPAQWGPMFGDLLHNLRSALDHLAIALVLRNKPSASTKRTAFPIFTDDPFKPGADKRTKDMWRTTIRGMHTTHVAAIKALQPFNQPHPEGVTDTLGLLGRLSNTDKHRGVIPLVGCFLGGEVRLVGDLQGWEFSGSNWVADPGPFTDGTEIASFGVLPPEPQANMEVNVGAVVRYGLTVDAEDIPATTEIDQVLRFLYTRVLDIVNDFEAKFFS